MSNLQGRLIMKIVLQLFEDALLLHIHLKTFSNKLKFCLLKAFQLTDAETTLAYLAVLP